MPLEIDNFKAIQNRLYLRLGARIWDLRNEGWEIATEQLSNKHRIQAN